jgi:hypothetical protein
MNARSLAKTLTLPALAAILSTVLISWGCGGGDNSNPAPTVRDSGTDSTMSQPETGGHDSGAIDAGHETSLPDTGSCMSDSSSCNTCYTDAQAAADPLNACSTYTKNCVPVTLTVPSHPTL